MLAMSSYAASTEIIPGATGTSTPDGPVDLFLPMPRLDNPLCADSPLEWVPDHEKATVPAEVAELCLACDVREKCLLWACLTQTPGYWAATTSQARREAASGDIRRLLANPTVGAKATHPPGAGSVRKYRAGCICDECRLANSESKAGERSRARERRRLLAAAASSAA